MITSVRTGFKFKLFLIFLILVYFQFNYNELPGNIGDARFNQFVLEHGYRWLNGIESSFWNVGVFFPSPNILAYSDSHIGTLPIYAMFRWVGVGRESAFICWIILICILNYVSAFFVLRKLTKSSLAAFLGAYFFALGLPITARFGHAQVIARFLVPLGFYFLFVFIERRSIKYYYMLLFCIVWQFYISIYTGYFLAFLLVITFLLWNISMPNGVARWHWKDTWNIKSHLVLGGGGTILAILPLAIPYYEASQVLGVRSWGEVSSMLPRVSSYFRAGPESWWSNILPDTSTLPMAHEHSLFVGGLPLLAIAGAGVILFTRWGKSEQFRYVPLMLLVLAGAVLSTSLIKGFSLYKLFFFIPGVGAIRVVSRIIVVMMFPISILLSTMIVFCIQNGRVPLWPKWVQYTCGALLIFVLAADQYLPFQTFSKVEAAASIEKMKSSIVKYPNAQALWARPEKFGSWDILDTQITAMLASQDLGLPTLNGYSGSNPPYYHPDMVQGSCEALRLWLSQTALAIDGSRLAQIGAVKPICDTTVSRRLPIFERGFHDLEGVLGSHVWASGKKAILLIPVAGTFKRDQIIEFRMETLVPRLVTIKYESQQPIVVQLTPGKRSAVRIPIILQSGYNRIELSTDVPARPPGGADLRSLSFSIDDIDIKS